MDDSVTLPPPFAPSAPGESASPESLAPSGAAPAAPLAPHDPADIARGEIERIDAALLDLLGERLRQVEILARAAPSGGLPISPAREVRLLRALIAGAKDRVEPEHVVEIWRALIGAAARRQRPIDVAVCVGAGPDNYRAFDLARRHFGARTRLHRFDDVRAALNRVAESDDVVAVVPWPGKTGAGMWWHALTESRYARLRLIGALPMRAFEGQAPEAAIVAAGAPLEAAGGDACLAIAFDRHFRIARALADAGIKGEEIARSDNKVLIRIEGYVDSDDPRFAAVARAGLDQFRVIGAFAQV
ncbi:MAG: hypothetical protein GC206_16580 [Alphaproteobacteria bacterium]|nr:hypothetical protein [Alphaproteobacteria bacterium]